MSPNTTIYSVSLRYQDPNVGSGAEFVATAPIKYEPEDNTIQIGRRPTGGQDLSGTYYHVHNYTHFVNLVNKALIIALNNLKSLLPTDALGRTALYATVAPYLDFDPTTNRVILHAHQFFFDEVAAETAGIKIVEIYFNERLYDLFVGLPYKYVSINGELNYRLRVMYNNNNFVPRNVLPENTIAINGDYQFKVVKFVQMYQEVSSIALWNPVASIIFASSLLPIQSTQTSLPKNVRNNNNNFTGSGNNSNLLQSITDFSIAVDGNNQYRPMVVYNPAAEYRLIDMHSSMNLNRIDIIVYWKDTFGNIHPFELHPGCAANVKLLFRRKDFNTTA